MNYYYSIIIIQVLTLIDHITNVGYNCTINILFSNNCEYILIPFDILYKYTIKYYNNKYKVTMKYVNILLELYLE